MCMYIQKIICIIKQKAKLKPYKPNINESQITSWKIVRKSNTMCCTSLWLVCRHIHNRNELSFLHESSFQMSSILITDTQTPHQQGRTGTQSQAAAPCSLCPVKFLGFRSKFNVQDQSFGADICRQEPNTNQTQICRTREFLILEETVFSKAGRIWVFGWPPNLLTNT